MKEITLKYSLYKLIKVFIDYMLYYLYCLIFGIIVYLKTRSFTPLYYGLVILSPILIMSQILLYNYYRYSKHISILIDGESAVLNNKDQSIALSKSNVRSIELHDTKHSKTGFNYSFVPWSGGSHYYYKVELEDGTHIFIPCILDNSSKIIKQTLEKLRPIEVIYRIYPYITMGA